MSKENNFNQTVDTLFQGMDGFISTKTIVGEPINVNGVLIIPLADVQFGVGAGAFASQDGKSNAGGECVEHGIKEVVVFAVSHKNRDAEDRAVCGYQRKIDAERLI